MKRRDFIKIFGAGAATTAIAACTGNTPQTTAGKKEPGEMTYRTSSQGDKVSLLGYGCMRWPTMTDADGKNVIDQEQVNSLVDYAIEHGVTYFDTAPVYGQGQSERVTGIALNRHPREKFLIATKLSNTQNYSREAALTMYRHSFEALQVDHIDYYLLHSVGGSRGDLSSMDVLQQRFFDNGILDFLLKEREAGHIRHLGFSFHGDQQVFDHLLKLHDDNAAQGGRPLWDFVQIQMNYVDWNHAQLISRRNVNASYLYGELERRGIPVVIMEPLLGGRLVNLPQHAADKLLARNPNASLASWAFRFCGTYPGVMCALSGMTYKEHLVDNLSTFCPVEPLTEEELTFLEEVADDYANHPIIPCNDCKYCMPCPYGVDIPGVFVHYNKCVNQAMIEENQQDPAYRKARRAYLVSLDRSLDRLRQANHCIGCAQCVDTCPQRIAIPAQMRRIEAFTEQLRRDQSPL
ncbi:MAG: aldo/keto reductase [Bacteroidales bacterium]|nr:aldo/keto reductase [Bacteroidales bacterium]